MCASDIMVHQFHVCKIIILSHLYELSYLSGRIWSKHFLDLQASNREKPVCNRNTQNEMSHLEAEICMVPGIMIRDEQTKFFSIATNILVSLHLLCNGIKLSYNAE